MKENVSGCFFWTQCIWMQPQPRRQTSRSDFHAAIWIVNIWYCCQPVAIVIWCMMRAL